MKLDKMQFAKMIAYVAGCVQRGTIDGTDVMVLDDLIDIQVETVTVPGKADATELNTLLASISQPGKKIEAIKAYRSLTGFGLKDAKDAVERYWREEKPVEFS